MYLIVVQIQINTYYSTYLLGIDYKLNIHTLSAIDVGFFFKKVKLFVLI